MGSFPDRRVTLALTCDQAFFFFSRTDEARDIKG